MVMQTIGLSSLGKVMTCNVRGLTNGKIPHLKEKFADVQILMMQETHGHESTINAKVLRLGFAAGVFAVGADAIK